MYIIGYLEYSIHEKSYCILAYVVVGKLSLLESSTHGQEQIYIVTLPYTLV